MLYIKPTSTNVLSFLFPLFLVMETHVLLEPYIHIRKVSLEEPRRLHVSVDFSDKDLVS